MLIKPDLSKAPEGATHWAPDTGEWCECWYRFENNLWYIINDYWASDVVERPWSGAAKAWKENGFTRLKRPITELIPVSELK